MAIGSTYQMFVNDLADMYNAEHQITQALPQMISQTTDQKLKDLFQQHPNQTKQQIQRLDQVWNLLGLQPQQVTCEGMGGILAEGKKTMQQAQSNMLLDGVMAGGADKVEHYEISSYSSLIMGAKMAGQNQVAQLLQQNLDEERWMAQQLEQCAPTLMQQAMAAEGAQAYGAQGQATQNP